MLEESQTQREGVHAAIGDVIHEHDIAGRLAHLASVKEQVFRVHPVSNDVGSRHRIALRPFVLVVGATQIDTAGMYVNSWAEQLEAHGAAFGMPAGKTDSPGCVPHQLRSGFRCLLPQGPVGVKSLGGIDIGVEFVSWPQFIKTISAESAVVSDGAGVEED